MSDINLPEYDAKSMNEIWFDDHEDFEPVGPNELEDPNRWGVHREQDREAQGQRHVLAADRIGLLRR
jgi:hypothetical protein